MSSYLSYLLIDIFIMDGSQLAKYENIFSYWDNDLIGSL